MAATQTGSRGRTLDAAALVVLGIVAFVVRAWPISEVSLWWDELVHAQTASRGGFFDVLMAAKLGIPPGFGNAGAVPLDYLLLHAWLRIAPEPGPEGMELYYRTPALLWSVFCVLLTYLYGRRFFDRGLGLVAASLLALSIPHSLYAAEVRFYSLFAFMTVVNLHTFSVLVERREKTSAWAVYTGVGVLYFLTGFLGLLALLVQYAVLAALLVVDAKRREENRSTADLLRLAFPLLSGLVVLGAVALYLQGTFLGVKYGRSVEGLSTWERSSTAFEFYSGESAILLGAFAVGVVVLLLTQWRRGRGPFAIACALTGSFLTIPVIVEIERWKEYYFHPRHSFFLMPLFAIVAAAGLLVTLRGLDPLRRIRIVESTRGSIYLAVSLALVMALQVAPLVQHFETPQRRFVRTKTLRDFKSLTHHLRDRIASLEDDQVYLLLAERGRPGHIGNPMLAKYLEWYGLDDRVVLRGTDRANEARLAIARECPSGCEGKPAAPLQRSLGAVGPFNTKREMLDLVELEPAPPIGAPVGAVGLLHYWRMRGGPPRRAPEFEIRLQRGMSLFEKVPPSVPGAMGTSRESSLRTPDDEAP